MEEIWLDMYYKAKDVINSKQITPFVNIGTNACVIRTNAGNLYSGINIDTSTSLNSCAESNAVIEMLKNGETEIDKMVIVNELEEVIKPCKKCLNFLLEFSSSEKETEILVDVAPIKITKLNKLLPSWFGTLRIKK